MSSYSCSWSVSSSSRLSLLWRLVWLHLQPSSSRGGTIHSRAHRLLKPRTPLDCPACCLTSTLSSGVESASAPVRPWREMKSRREAPKRVNTEGFACPNQQCPSSGIPDARDPRPRRRWQAWACRAHPDVSGSCLPYHVHCPAPHSLLSSENPLPTDRRGADSAGRRVGSFGGSTCRRAFGKPLARAFLSRAGSHAQTLHERFFCHLHLPHLQLEELRTR
jgi:hypothetical protein